MTRNAIIDFVLAALQIPFIIQDPTRWFNWIALVFCSCVGIMLVIRDTRQ